MKALTITQPWATLVAIGAKRIETRSWSTSYRGPLAIHAAKGFPTWAKESCEEDLFWAALMANYPSWERTFVNIPSTVLPMGRVVATCNLVDVLPMEATGCLPGVFDDYPELDTPQERAFGDYAPGRFAWVLEGAVKLHEPIPAKGALRLWGWTQNASVSAQP